MSKKLKKRLYKILIVSIIFFALIVADKMGKFSYLPQTLVFAMYFFPYIIIGYDVIIKAAKDILHGQIFNENFLMTVATAAAFLLGVFGDGQYPEALAVMLFYQIGELFQDYAVGKSRQSISQMMDIAPRYANLLKDGNIIETDPEEVHIGDMILIKPGEIVPLDGTVTQGSSFVDTGALTGESVPRKVDVGDKVISGCLNGESAVKVRVEKEYEDSTVSRILELVENASSKKAKLENFITKFAKYYTPAVTVFAVVLAIFVPVLFGVSWTQGIKRACNFLIISCPCALVISVPLGFFGGIGAASKIGILIKGSNFVEAASKLSVIVMDKTGTLTKGEFKVQKVIYNDGYSKEYLLMLAAIGEGFSNHPIAHSIIRAYGKTPDLTNVNNTKEISGRGIKASFESKQLILGNEKLMQSENIAYKQCEENGTLVYVAYDRAYIGCIVISDSIKAGAQEAVSEMKRAGVKSVVMLTGDHKNTAESIAKKLNIDKVISELLPQDKVNELEKIMKTTENCEEHLARVGKVGFVGDGINDAPVLMRSDVGIAMGSFGSDAAIEAADIVLMDDDIRKIPIVIRIAKKTMSIVKSNIAFALSVKFLILVLSAFGVVSMWAAVFGDVGVAVLCILNSMRALKFKTE